EKCTVKENPSVHDQRDSATPTHPLERAPSALSRDSAMSTLQFQPAPDHDVRCKHDYQISCSNCRLAGICLPIALEATDIDKLDSIIQRGRPLRKSEHAYRENTPFTSVYAVRSGTLKAYRVTDDGQEQVTGFYCPGEILGMDGISKN